MEKKASETEVKAKFQTLFMNKAQDIFGANPSIFTNPNINIQSDVELKQLADKGELVTHPILNFIKIK